MKKSNLLALLLALTMLLSLAACGGNDDKQPDDSTPGQIGRASCRERV